MYKWLIIVPSILLFLVLPTYFNKVKADPPKHFGFTSPLVPTKCTTWNPILSGKPWYMTQEKYDSYTTTMCTEWGTTIGEDGSDSVSWGK